MNIPVMVELEVWHELDQLVDELSLLRVPPAAEALESAGVLGRPTKSWASPAASRASRPSTLQRGSFTAPVDRDVFRNERASLAS
jgi:hypothetical protein